MTDRDPVDDRGWSLVPFAGIAFLWFMGVVRDRFQESEDQLFSSVFIGSGLLFLAMVFVSRRDRRRDRRPVPFIADEASRAEVATFGRAVMLQVSNIYALRMAGVMLISLGYDVAAHGRDAALAGVGDLRGWAIVLLFVTSLSMWVALIFPAWVFGVSILILVQNFRRERGAAHVAE